MLEKITLNLDKKESLLKKEPLLMSTSNYKVKLDIYQQMIVDAILLLLVVVGLQLVKNKFPNFLFYPKGAVLFLPPEETEENKPKKKK